MTIQQALKKYPKLETDLLLAHVLRKPKEFLYLHTEAQLSPAQQKRFLALAGKRKAGVPIAYLVGYKYFFALKFKVNRQVLIPRPETEWMVEQALEILRLAQESKSKLRVLDIGTGSGAIAISIAKHSKAEVTATEISSAALKVAKQNAAAHQVKVKFLKGNLLESLPGKFDIILANLPYVPAKDYAQLYNNLKYEPKFALVDKASDFELFRKLMPQLPTRLNPRGKIILEIDPSYATEITRLGQETFPEKRVEIIADFRGQKRFVYIH